MTDAAESLINELLSKDVKKVTNTFTFGKALIYITGGLAVSVSVICIPFVSPAFRKICLPYVPATNIQLAGVAKALSDRSGTLLDVGSGDGRIVFAAAKLGFQSYGVELNPWLYVYSKISALFSPYRNNVKFFRKNLWTFNLSPYDNIVIFGVEQMMKDFEHKLCSEVKAGAVIVACRFPLPNMKPIETIGHGVDTVWKYVIRK
ncbi:Protein FAM173B [Eumeta japonica]|uniref:Protein FAM173B n=1 Tax=Eumeta variegata TaxID=151549 RepID=A0A4C1XUW2_EUMVA|nr:Protein FAM173B [Eumeta japonica]